MGRRRARRRGAVGVALAALALAACDPWRCDFYSHGACVEFTEDPADLVEAQARMDALLSRELPFWGLANLGGWRIHFRDTSDYPCYLADRNDGCTDYIENTLSVRIPPGARGCFEAAELLHELGHYALGDPMHSNDRWRDVEGAFPSMVWNFPGAPEDCVTAYYGRSLGMWPVNIDSF